jgi:hypothetical protein
MESILNNKYKIPELLLSISLSLSLANNNKRISYGGTVNQSIRVERPNFECRRKISGKKDKKDTKEEQK